MRKIISIDLAELKAISLSLNAYLALLMYKWGDIKYNVTEKDKEELTINQWIKNNILSEKAEKYFNDLTEFNTFYNLFPFTVTDNYGRKRPLRTSSIETNAAKVTKNIWKNKFRGNKELQKHVIEVLKAEVEWRESTDSLVYMNNIDTWIRSNNWEKYEYLLNNNKSIITTTKRI